MSRICHRGQGRDWFRNQVLKAIKIEKAGGAAFQKDGAPDWKRQWRLDVE
jgi:hypothetical protein